MTDLERFAAVLLAEWLQEGRHQGDAIAVGSLLDRTLPYRSARKLLGIDVSEDYEMLVLRLIAEEDGLVQTEPTAAATMARETLASKLPDLDLLRRLHSAAMTFTDEAVDRLEGVRPMPVVVAEAPPPPAPMVPEASVPAPRTVFPIRPEVSVPTEVPTPPNAPAEPPAEFLTGVAFTPPAAGCWSCQAPLPTDRVVKFCVACGADQRAPSCPGCGTTVERGWKFCPECGGGVG
jgi:hypothetical protein